MKPMLAYRYQDRGHRYPDEFHIQPKLNGVRMLYSNTKLQSRDEILWRPNRLPHLRDILLSVPPHIVLDGELYLHGLPLQQINSAASVKALNDSTMSAKLEYWVFDMFDTTQPQLRFSVRSQILRDLVTQLQPPVIFCPTFKSNRLLAEHFYLKAKRQGFEGVMYRLSDKPYGLLAQCSNKENRWESLLKRKGYLDAEVDVLEPVEGEGKYLGMMGALTCEYEGKRFNVGTGFSDAERVRFWETPPTRIRIHFESLSDTGVPTQPRYECEYE